MEKKEKNFFILKSIVSLLFYLRLKKMRFFLFMNDSVIFFNGKL